MNINRLVDSYRQDIISAVQKLVRIPSVEGDPGQRMPFGIEVNRALKYVLKLSNQLGFNTKDFDGYGGCASFGRGDTTMGILAHLDVVPAGDGWTKDPFGGELDNGKIYGRGAIDDKGPLIGALFAMKAVKESGVNMNRRVKMIFGTDEESGWKDMDYIFKTEPMPDFGITPDADYPVIHAEKGIVTVILKKNFSDSSNASVRINHIKGGQRANMVADGCSCRFEVSEEQDKILTHLNSFHQYTDQNYLIDAEMNQDGSIELISHGRTAHASTPDKGCNAIGQMLVFLGTLGLGCSEMEEFILFLNDSIGMNLDGSGLDIAFKDSVSGPLTLNLGVIDINQRWGRAVINIRYPVSHTRDQILSRIKTALIGTGIDMELEDCHDPLFVPEDDDLIVKLKQVYENQTGETARALAIGGGTYARAIKNAVGFGAMFPGSPDLMHKKDEYIDVEELMLHTRIYANAIVALCSQA